MSEHYGVLRKTIEAQPGYVKGAPFVVVQVTYLGAKGPGPDVILVSCHRREDRAMEVVRRQARDSEWIVVAEVVD